MSLFFKESFDINDYSWTRLKDHLMLIRWQQLSVHPKRPEKPHNILSWKDKNGNKRSRKIYPNGPDHEWKYYLWINLGKENVGEMKCSLCARGGCPAGKGFEIAFHGECFDLMVQDEMSTTQWCHDAYTNIPIVDTAGFTSTKQEKTLFHMLSRKFYQLQFDSVTENRFKQARIKAGLDLVSTFTLEDEEYFDCFKMTMSPLERQYWDTKNKYCNKLEGVDDAKLSEADKLEIALSPDDAEVIMRDYMVLCRRQENKRNSGWTCVTTKFCNELNTEPEIKKETKKEMKKEANKQLPK